MTPAKQHTPQPGTALGYLIGSYVVFMAIMTPLIALGWNLGLVGADITEHSIGWGTALGLSIVVMVLRSIMAGARPIRGL